jgi:hypothetical protein
VPHPEQKDIATKYQLEAGTTYYEAFEGSLGLISISGEEPPSVTKIRQFCRAAAAPVPNLKIRELTKLLGSRDPELERASSQAIEFFRQEMIRR